MSESFALRDKDPHNLLTVVTSSPVIHGKDGHLSGDWELRSNWFSLDCIIDYSSTITKELEHIIIWDWLGQSQQLFWILILYKVDITLNSSVVVRGMAVKRRPCWHFRGCGWGCVRGKVSYMKGCEYSLLNWHRTFEFVLHFIRCDTVTVSSNQINIIISSI